MAILLSGVAAFVWGIADFLGGFATRKSPVIVVTFVAALGGLALGLVASPLISGPILVDFAWGAAAGVGAAIGLGLLYFGLGTGPVGVVAPISSVVGAVVPFVVGVALFDERPASRALAGSALAFMAILMITMERSESRASRRVILVALGAGVGFGLFFIFLSFVGSDSGLWSLVGSKATNVVMFGALLIGRRVPIRTGQGYAIPVAAGILDMAANIAVLFALRSGLVSLVAVVTGLFPITTMILARFVLGEHFRKVQLAGIALALMATALIASS